MTEYNDQLLSRIELPNNHHALDFGLGCGHISQELLDAGLRVSAIDMDAGCGTTFRDQLSPEQQSRFDFRQLDANLFPYPFDDESFDIIVCREVLEHIEQYEQTLSEFRRLIRKEGVLAMSVPAYLSERAFAVLDPHWFRKCEHVNLFPRKGLQELLHRRGFDCYHTRGTGFRWSLMWGMLTPFRVDHVMGNFKSQTRLNRVAFDVSERISHTRINRIGNRLFPKSVTYLSRKRKYRVLVIYDYDDWILGRWATEMQKILQPDFDVETIAMDKADAQFIRDNRGQFDVCHPLLPHVYDIAAAIEATVTITTIHHWTRDGQYQDIIAKSRYFVTGADAWKQAIVDRGVDAGSVIVLRSGASEAFFDTKPDRSPRADRLSVGVFAKADSNEDHRKGIDRLARLLALISEKGLASNYHFVISGDGWESTVADFRAMGLSLDYRGRVDANRMISLYDAIDAYVILSRIEGGPATLSEAMARACVVVSTPVGLALDTISHGINGLLVSQHDDDVVEQVLESLELVRRDLDQRGAISDAARQYAELNLRYVDTFRGLDRFYDSCLQASLCSEHRFSIRR